MDIVSRNFFRLLRSGVFGETELIEPMSAYKWRRVYQYSLMHNLTALIDDGTKKCKEQFFLQLPEDLKDTWHNTTLKIARENDARNAVMHQLYTLLNDQQLRPILLNGLLTARLYDKPNHCVNHSISFYFPYQTQGNKADKWARNHCEVTDDGNRFQLVYNFQGQLVEHHHRMHILTNKLLNHTLQSIIEKEFRENEATYITVGNTRVEVASHTLTLLLILLHIAQHILSNGISLKHLTDLGVFLRKEGDKVDYVKLQTWIDKLHMQRLAHLSAVLLIDLLHFTDDELPFMKPDGTRDITKVTNELFTMKPDKGNWYFQQGEDIFVHATNSTAMMWHVRQSAKNFRYYPSESLTNFFASIAHSLSHIEE